MSPRRFVIPDVHGCCKTLIHLVQKVLRLTPRDSLYLLGDFIDRGPSSKEVLDFMMRLADAGYRVYPIRGNHEEMFLHACRDRNSFRLWMLNGGQATLTDFGVEDACEIPLKYRRFCESLPYYRQLDDFILVHAGLNFQVSDPFADTDTMLWSRTLEADPARIGGRRIICGHTTLRLDDIRQNLKKNIITLDNGCVYSGKPGLGNLLALELDTMSLHVQVNIDLQ